jgi:hypothetical protein
MIAAGTMAASAAYYLQVARARLTLWAAADVSIASRLSDASVAIDRCILVPVYELRGGRHYGFGAGHWLLWGGLH